MRRNLMLPGISLLVVGLFWSGRESAHGLSAFWHHWWCALPVMLVVAGVALLVGARRATAS